MRLIFFLCILLISYNTATLAQTHSIGFFGIINKYQSHSNFLHQKKGKGISMSYHFHDTGKIKLTIFRNFYSHICLYQGEISAINTSAAGAFRHGCDLKLTRMNFSLGWLPLNIKIPDKKGRLLINLGFEYNLNLASKGKGTVYYTKYNDSTPPWWPFFIQINETVTSNKQLNLRKSLLGIVARGSYAFIQKESKTIHQYEYQNGYCIFRRRVEL